MEQGGDIGKPHAEEWMAIERERAWMERRQGWSGRGEIRGQESQSGMGRVATMEGVGERNGNQVKR